MTTPQPTGQVAVLRDYPVRLWAAQDEYSQGVLREFGLLVAGESSGVLLHAPPGQLLALADMFWTNFADLLDVINGPRREAAAQGLDRIDSRVPLVVGTPELIAQVDGVLTSVDDFCRTGSLLTLPREPWMLALSRWTNEELIKQYEGRGEPSPWPGPFEVPD